MNRPIEFKIRAYQLYKRSKLSPVDAFKQAGQEYGVELSGCMTTLKYAHSYMATDIKNYIKKRLDTKAVVEKLKDFDLTKDDFN